MKLEGSRTQANLMAAFAGESQARNKYTFYANIARRDGYEQMAALFEETAANELAHAWIWMKLLRENDMPQTKGALEDAAGGEHFEHTEMYPKFAAEAREEGFDHIAFLFDEVANIEQGHEQRFRALIENLEDGLVFSRKGDAIWQCRVCGHIYVGQRAPEVCPVCAHPQAFFQLQQKNY